MTRNSCDGVWAAENFFKSLCVKTTVITKHVRIVIIEQKKPLNQLYPRYHAIALGIGFPLDKLKKQLYNILFSFLGIMKKCIQVVTEIKLNRKYIDKCEIVFISFQYFLIIRVLYVLTILLFSNPQEMLDYKRFEIFIPNSMMVYFIYFYFNFRESDRFVLFLN